MSRRSGRGPVSVQAVAVDVGALQLGPARADALLACWSAAERPPVAWLLGADACSAQLVQHLAGTELRFPLGQMGLAAVDPHVLEMVAALAGCRVRNVLVLTGVGGGAVDAARSIGAQLVEVAQSDELPLAVAGALLSEGSTGPGPEVGVGPHPEPWPADDRFDPELLRLGDRRNVIDRYRYWSEAAIVADLALGQLPLHVAVENWQHDLNIGTVVRNANAFGVAGVHIVGARRWNRRGAMATDRYLHVHHHPTVADLVGWAAADHLALVGVDNVPGSVPIETATLPARAVLVFGQEGPGLSPEMAAACSQVCAITQYGSTRSLNVGVASGIALYAWTRQHR